MLTLKQFLLEKSKAAEQADHLGLEYYGFGKYGKNGKATHKVVNNFLEPIQHQSTSDKFSNKKTKIVPDKNLKFHYDPDKSVKHGDLEHYGGSWWGKNGEITHKKLDNDYYKTYIKGKKNDDSGTKIVLNKQEEKPVTKIVLNNPEKEAVDDTPKKFNPDDYEAYKQVASGFNDDDFIHLKQKDGIDYYGIKIHNPKSNKNIEIETHIKNPNKPKKFHQLKNISVIQKTFNGFSQQFTFELMQKGIVTKIPASDNYYYNHKDNFVLKKNKEGSFDFVNDPVNTFNKLYEFLGDGKIFDSIDPEDLKVYNYVQHFMDKASKKEDPKTPEPPEEKKTIEVPTKDPLNPTGKVEKQFVPVNFGAKDKVDTVVKKDKLKFIDTVSQGGVTVNKMGIDYYDEKTSTNITIPTHVVFNGNAHKLHDVSIFQPNKKSQFPLDVDQLINDGILKQVTNTFDIYYSVPSDKFLQKLPNDGGFKDPLIIMNDFKKAKEELDNLYGGSYKLSDTDFNFMKKLDYFKEQEKYNSPEYIAKKKAEKVKKEQEEKEKAQKEAAEKIKTHLDKIGVFHKNTFTYPEKEIEDILKLPDSISSINEIYYNVFKERINEATKYDYNDDLQTETHKKLDKTSKIEEVNKDIYHSIRKSLVHYTESGYKTLNKGLYDNNKLYNEYAEMDKNMSTAFKNVLPTEDEFTVYSGIKRDHRPTIEADGVFTCPAYMSSSLKYRKAEAFTRALDAAIPDVIAEHIMKIRVPKGKRFLSVKNISSHSSEDECIFHKNSKFKIEKHPIIVGVGDFGVNKKIKFIWEAELIDDGVNLNESREKKFPILYAGLDKEYGRKTLKKFVKNHKDNKYVNKFKKKSRIKKTYFKEEKDSIIILFEKYTGE